MDLFRITFLQMEFLASLMIIAIIIFRAVGIHYISKRILVISWCITIVRLLVPISIPMSFGIPVQGAESGVGASLEEGIWETELLTSNMPDIAESSSQISSRLIIWAIGFGLCVLYFGISYLVCRYEFSQSSPLENEDIFRWLDKHPTKRKIRVRSISNISSPLTYGIISPTILLPTTLEWEDEETLNFILLHEYIHIRYFDSVIKIFLASCLCIHWFNPLVWVMFLLANRDVELACDESVVQVLGEKRKSAYALTLIKLADSSDVCNPVLNHFCKNAITERIEAIMKMKKTSLLATILALILIMCSTTAFAASAADDANISGNDSYMSNTVVIQTNQNDMAGTSFGQEAFESVNEETTLIPYDDATVYSADVEVPAPFKSVSLSPGMSYKFDRRYYRAGTKIDIYASWNPDTVDLKLGVYSETSDSAITDKVTDGEGGVVTTIKKSGYFYIYVSNTSRSESADINISYAY